MKIILLLGALLALAGCGEEKEAPTDRPASGPLVTFEKGGGIASSPHKLVVQRDGKATLEAVVPDRRTEQLTLTEDELATLTEAVEAAEGVEVPEITGGCADCFVYQVSGSGLDFSLDSVSYSDDGTPEELVALVAILDELAGP